VPEGVLAGSVTTLAVVNPSRGRSWTTPGQISLTAPKQPACAIPAASKTASRSSVLLPNGMNTTANSSSPTSSASGSDSQLPDPKCFSCAYTTRTSSRWVTLILNTNTETSQIAAIGRRRGRLRTKRRSLFGFPGTASSPDLATLVRKQRERNVQLPGKLPRRRLQTPGAPQWPAEDFFARNRKGGLASILTSIP